MTTNTISLRDKGNDFEVTLTEGGSAVDISAATALAIIFIKPSGGEVEKVATVVNTGVDGKLHYARETGVDDPIDETGEGWKYYGKVTFSASQVFHSVDPQGFTVID